MTSQHPPFRPAIRAAVIRRLIELEREGDAIKRDTAHTEAKLTRLGFRAVENAAAVADLRDGLGYVTQEEHAAVKRALSDERWRAEPKADGGVIEPGKAYLVGETTNEETLPPPVPPPVPPRSGFFRVWGERK